MLRLLFALCILSGATAQATLSADGEIRGFKLDSCLPNEGGCVRASSPVASGSFLRPVYTFESLDVALNKNAKTRKWTAVRGWFDLEANQLIVIDKRNKETIINLDTLNVLTPET